MNQQWLTTLMSNVKTQLKSRLEEQLQSRGIRLNAADLAALLEDISPKTSNAALSYMVEIMRPFTSSMGLRVARLTDSQIEIILPFRERNKNGNQEIHEGALIAGAIEGAQLLWERHAPLGDLCLRAVQMHCQIFKPCKEDMRIRLELTEALRESVLAELRQERRSQVEMLAQIYDDNDQAMAEIQLHMEMTHTPRLSSRT